MTQNDCGGNPCPRQGVMFACQCLILFIVIAVSLYNLSITTPEECSKEALWALLISGCLGICCPGPVIKWSKKEKKSGRLRCQRTVSGGWGLSWWLFPATRVWTCIRRTRPRITRFNFLLRWGLRENGRSDWWDLTIAGPGSTFLEMKPTLSESSATSKTAQYASHSCPQDTILHPDNW